MNSQNKLGLNDEDFKILTDLVLDPLKRDNVEVFAFGSRARGKHHPFSDLDLLLVPLPDSKFSIQQLSEIKESIEDSRFPIKVDLVFLSDLAKSYLQSVLEDRLAL